MSPPSLLRFSFGCRSSGSGVSSRKKAIGSSSCQPTARVPISLCPEPQPRETPRPPGLRYLRYKEFSPWATPWIDYFIQYGHRLRGPYTAAILLIANHLTAVVRPAEP